MIVNGNAVHRVKPGEIVGEMIVWFGGVRQATLKASTSGVIATLLMGELQELSYKHPAVAAQFMRVMGTQSVNSYLAFKVSKVKGKMSTPVLLLDQASAADAAPHWEAFFAPLREQHPISAAAAECFKAASTVHKFEKASKLVKPGGAIDFVMLLLTGSVDVSAQGMREALPSATYSGREFVGEHAYFAAEGLEGKIEVTASKAGSGLVAVLPITKLQEALEQQGELVFPITQMLGQNAMAHSRGEVHSTPMSTHTVATSCILYGYSLSCIWLQAIEVNNNASRGKSGKKEGHMEVFYRKRMLSLAGKTADAAQALGDQAAKAERVAHKAKNEAFILQKEAETLRSENERLAEENRELVESHLEAVELRRENEELKELTQKHAALLRDSTREYFTEAMEKKDSAMKAYRNGMERAEARLKHIMETSATAIEKAGTADNIIGGLQRALESLQAAHTATCAKLTKLQMSKTLQVS